MVFDEFRGFFRRNPEKGVIYLLFSFFFVYFAANFKKMKKILYIVLMVAAMVSCGSDYEEQKRLSKAERLRLAKEDSAALKVGTLPTMDCLPLFLAKEHCMFDTAKADIRLKCFDSQIDCDAALKKGSIEGNVTDLVRGERMKRGGLALKYATATNAGWQFVSNRLSRVTELKHLNEKMVAMARFSATHLLAQMAVDSAKLGRDNVFLVQINDPNIRLKMLLNNEIDAMLLPEPQATTARMWKHPVLMDTRLKDMKLGVVAFREKALADKNRKKQYEVFVKGYNTAVDSINKYGVKKYGDLIMKYMKADQQTIDALPDMKYERMKEPRAKDLAAAARLAP